MYDDSERRYRNDTAFRTAVDWMQSIAEKEGFTPGELKQIAFYAALRIELYSLKRHPDIIAQMIRADVRTAFGAEPIPCKHCEGKGCAKCW